MRNRLVREGAQRCLDFVVQLSRTTAMQPLTLPEHVREIFCNIARCDTPFLVSIHPTKTHHPRRPAPTSVSIMIVTTPHWKVWGIDVGGMRLLIVRCLSSFYQSVREGHENRNTMVANLSLVCGFYFLIMSNFIHKSLNGNICCE